MKFLKLVSLDRQLCRFWIILHRTTTQRIDTQIWRVVHLGKPNKVSDNFGLRDFGKRRAGVPPPRACRIGPPNPDDLPHHIARYCTGVDSLVLFVTLIYLGVL